MERNSIKSEQKSIICNLYLVDEVDVSIHQDRHIQLKHEQYDSVERMIDIYIPATATSHESFISPKSQ